MEVTEDDGFVKVRAIDALERKDGLGAAEVVRVLWVFGTEGPWVKRWGQEGGEGQESDGLGTHEE